MSMTTVQRADVKSTIKNGSRYYHCSKYTSNLGSISLARHSTTNIRRIDSALDKTRSNTYICVGTQKYLIKRNTRTISSAHFSQKYTNNFLCTLFTALCKRCRASNSRAQINAFLDYKTLKLRFIECTSIKCTA